MIAYAAQDTSFHRYPAVQEVIGLVPGHLVGKKIMKPGLMQLDGELWLARCMEKTLLER